LAPLITSYSVVYNNLKSQYKKRVAHRVAAQMEEFRPFKSIQQLWDLANPFANFLPVFLQTDANANNQTLEVFAGSWMIGVA